MDEIAIIDGRRANLGVAARDFKYYIFDWDDNILHMPTRIHMEKLGDAEVIKLALPDAAQTIVDEVYKLV